MNLTTISEISREMNLSTRTLRYYEQIGLIESVKKDDYAYRTYDEATVARLRQILVLRKLRIPLKQIGLILQSENTAEIIDAFQQNLNEVDDEISALSTIREIINTFVERLKESIQQDIMLNLLDDSALLEAVDALTVQKIPLKEEKTVGDLQSASEKLNRLTDRDVRIVYLPPATVAAYQYVGDEPEAHCNQVIDKFVIETGLVKIKPDIRHYGFNAPNPVKEDGYHGYEMWVTIPDDMEVPAPIMKKKFEGGLYAAHMIPFGNFEEWGWLWEWVQNNPMFDGNSGEKGSECMWGLLEEHLNYVNHVTLPNTEPEGLQLDLLHPIKPKVAQSTKHPQEKIIDTFNYNGASVEVVEWDETIWCGKIGYDYTAADDHVTDWVKPILDGFFKLNTKRAKQRVEPDWDVCMNVDILSKERPDGVLFGFLVGTDKQPRKFDVIKVPAGQYLRIAFTDENAKALGAPPFHGGKPPYEWVGEQLAPQFGYTYGDDRLPVFEYYGFWNAERNAHEFRYLYVPVEKKI